jgi:hypothetical protein
MAGFSALALEVGAQSEIQQQLEGVSSTLGTVSEQVQAVKEKGLFQAVWDNVTAPIAAIWQQITGILGQIGSIFSTVSK